MRKFFLTLTAIFFLLVNANSQNRTISGKVLNGQGQGITRASIFVKGTKIGTTTDSDGNFTLSVPSNAKTLLISSVNMTPQEIAITGSPINVSLNENTASLQEVVITSLGIARDKRSLGYATQTIKGADIADRGEINIVNALQGKVAGVNITNASGSAGASTNINIRGISSFTGSNQPLFVIDGIPVSNDVDRTNGSSQGTLGDYQPSNRALDIDMNNVESLNVLKGPAAAVLYGSRAAAGAIIITTKKGGNTKGKADVILNTSYSFQDAFGLPSVQNLYGQGANGIYNPTSSSSFGPRFGSTPSIANGLIINGVPVTNYQAFPNNINDFFQQGHIAENSITINGGDAIRNQTFSIGNVKQDGILPNTFLKRTNVRIGVNSMMGEKISVGSSLTYTNTVQQGIFGGNSNSALANVLGLARNINLTAYKDSGNYKNPNGTNNYLLPSLDNPYFDAYENPLTSNLNRFSGNANIGYKAFSWLNLSYRLGLDMYTDRRKQIFAIGSGRSPLGQALDNTIFRNEVNGDFIATATKNNLFIRNLKLTGILGQNINQRKVQNTLIQADALAVPGFYNVSNGPTLTNGTGESNTIRRLVGYYAQTSFSYNNAYFLEFTGRIDQSSTLPKNKSSYFYPSVNASIILTDAFKLNSKILSYAKIRANYAKVGRDADPYLLNNLYVSQGFGNNVASFSFPFGTTAGFGASSRIAPTSLSPEFTTSYEYGLVLQFFNNRASLEVTTYNQDSKAQIIGLALAPSTGFSTFTTNIGELTNKGLEVVLTGTLLRTRDFSWDVNGNYTRQRSLVVSIAPGVDNSFIPGNRFGGSIASFKENYPYGVIIGNTIPRNADGERLINPATGTYQPGVAGGILADPNPDYSLGISNNFKYKNFNLDFTFDFTKGGQVLSFTAATYKGRGALDITAIDREQPHILPGVILDANGKSVPNNIQISGQTYWAALGGLQSEFNVYDATVLKLRTLSFGYSIPTNITKRLRISGMRFGIFGNNIFYVAPNSPIDPQLNTQGAGNIRGLDLQGAPNARTIGANLKITL